jgi:hypothetical protein
MNTIIAAGENDMKFDLGELNPKREFGKLRGIQQEIACDCWFTSQGRSIPHRIKVMDQAGVLHMVDQIQVLYSQEKHYCGIATVEHVCKIELADTQEVVNLVFCKENLVWKLVKK